MIIDNSLPGLDPIRASEEFLGTLFPHGPVRSAVSRIVSATGAAILHERIEFDRLGRLTSWLRYDDDGTLYKQEVFSCPGADTAGLSRRSGTLLEDGSSFEWLYEPAVGGYRATCIDSRLGTVAVWFYQADASGRITECVEEDGQGVYERTNNAEYDQAGRLVSLEEAAPHGIFRYRYTYGPSFRRIHWDGCHGGTWEQTEDYTAFDARGNWLAMTEISSRDGQELGEPWRVVRQIEYFIDIPG